ncbi:MAG: sigma-70 family RNA polymerase sigma factor [Bacteroidota bacterium]
MDSTYAFNREALPQLDALRDYAMSLCRDPQRTADLVQDTMLKAYRKFDTYQPGTNCRAWLFQICKHCFINDCRRKKLQPLATDFDEEGPRSEWSPDDFRQMRVKGTALQEEIPERGILGDEVAAALEGLQPDYQTALLLSAIEGYSYEEIAEFTKAPLGTVRSRIHRARKQLSRQLAEYAREEGFVRTAA